MSTERIHYILHIKVLFQMSVVFTECIEDYNFKLFNINPVGQPTEEYSQFFAKDGHEVYFRQDS